MAGSVSTNSNVGTSEGRTSQVVAHRWYFPTFRFPLLLVSKLSAADQRTCDPRTFRRATLGRSDVRPCDFLVRRSDVRPSDVPTCDLVLFVQVDQVGGRLACGQHVDVPQRVLHIILLHRRRETGAIGGCDDVLQSVDTQP